MTFHEIPTNWRPFTLQITISDIGPIPSFALLTQISHIWARDLSKECVVWHSFILLDRIFNIAWFDLCSIAKCQLFTDIFPTLVRYQWSYDSNIQHWKIAAEINCSRGKPLHKKIYYRSIMVRATDSQISFDSSSHQKEDRRAHCDPAKERILYLYLQL